jgi:basic membrane protein A
MYPEVNFILIDGYPNNGKYDATRVEFTAENTVGIKYAEEQAGYLAGYAAVVDGYTKLGFMGGMAVPAVVRFGYGFVQGADDAAVALGIDKIEINYHYTGDFIASPASHSKAAAWFNDGIEVIFACGGAVGNSVMAAAEETGGKVIGVDVDQGAESETVITSSMKGLAASVELTLAAYDAGEFPGGQNLVMDATNDGVGLPMETSKFVKFTQADYDELYAKLQSLSVEIQNDEDVENAAELTLNVTAVSLIE